jgi:three-Cys-motif partner protein
MSVVAFAYIGREQTAVKHRILEHYLTPLPLIVGRSWHDVTFVDCCSGPWETNTADKSDSSFGIAIRQLRQARDILKGEGRRVNFRCLFIERDLDAYVELEKFCATVTDLEVKPRRGDFVALIPEILRFINERPNSFPFFFIDPKGWSPLKITALTPLLQCKPGEVLINFMTSHIRRFLADEGKDFGALLGSAALESMCDLTGQERDDAAAFAYADQLALAGRFDYVCTTLVLKPQTDQTHYHLIYATRHHKGVEEFKNSERNAKEFMSRARADAQQRHRVESTGQSEMFVPEVCGAGDDHYLLGLRDRYLALAHDLVERQLIRNPRSDVRYDDAWKIACRFPFVYESDLHNWIAKEWRHKIRVLGMKPNQKVPKCRSNNLLRWIG